MILFKPEHVEPILAGTKTQTRRLGKKRWNVGATHQCRTRMMDASSTFARVKILGVSRQRLGDISFAGAKAEGYPSPDAYFDAWKRIHGAFDPKLEVWVVDFFVVKEVRERA